MSKQTYTAAEKQIYARRVLLVGAVVVVLAMAALIAKGILNDQPMLTVFASMIAVGAAASMTVAARQIGKNAS